MNKKKIRNSGKSEPNKAPAPQDDSHIAPGGELHQCAGGEHPALTTNQGVPLSDNQNSLKASPRGPALLEDFILREKITHFDHERIPERIVHARATGVHLRHIKPDPAQRVATGLGLDKLPVAPTAAAPVQTLPPSPALQIISKMKSTLQGRSIGILIADGSDGAAIKRLKKAATAAGAAVKIIAPKIGGAKLADGSSLAADGQLAGTPSVLFDAVAVILSEAGSKTLVKEGAAIDFVRDAFGHLKAVAADEGGQALLRAAKVAHDAGVVDARDKDAFIAAAKTRQWDRGKSVRTLA